MKMSFDVEIPDWVSWIAQDEDSRWYGYMDRPELKEYKGEWGEERMIDLACGTKPKDWTVELYEIIR